MSSPLPPIGGGPPVVGSTSNPKLSYQTAHFQQLFHDDAAVPLKRRVQHLDRNRSVISFQPTHAKVSDLNALVNREKRLPSTAKLHRNISETFVQPVEGFTDAVELATNTLLNWDEEDDNPDGFAAEANNIMAQARGGRLNESQDRLDLAIQMRKKNIEKLKTQDALSVDQRLVFGILASLDKHQIDDLHHTFSASPHGLDKYQFIAALRDCLRTSHAFQRALRRPDEEEASISFDESSSSTSPLRNALNAIAGRTGSPTRDEVVERRMIEQLEEAFQRIDVRSTGLVLWESFCDYVLYGGESNTDIATMEITKYNPTPEIDEPRNDEEIRRLTYAPVIKKMLSCHNNGLVSVWQPGEAKLIKRLEGHTSAVYCAMHVPAHGENEGRLVTSGADRTIITWDEQTFNQTAQWRTGFPAISMAWSRETQRLFTGDTECMIKSYALKNAGASLNELPRVHTDWVSDLVCIDEIGTLVSVSYDAKVLLWDVASPRLKSTLLGHQKPIYACCYHMHSRFIVTAGQEHDLYVWNPFVSRAMHKITGHDKPVLHVMPGSGPNELISADEGGKIKVWDIRRFVCMQTLGGRGSTGFVKPFVAMATVPSQSCITTVGRRWCFYRPQGEVVTNAASKWVVTHVMHNTAFGTLLVVGGAEATSWRLSDGKMVGVFSAISDVELSTVCLDKTGKCFYVANVNGVIAAFNATTGVKLQDFQVYTGASDSLTDAQSVGVRPPQEVKAHDRFTLASGEDIRLVDDIVFMCDIGHFMLLIVSLSGLVAIFDIAHHGSERVLYILHKADETSGALLQAAALSSDGHLFAAGGTGPLLHVWRMDTFSGLREIPLQFPVTSCTFANEINAFITGDTGHYINVYSSGSFNRLLRIPLGGDNIVQQMQYTNVGRILVTDHRTNVDGVLHPLTWSMATMLRRFHDEYAASRASTDRGDRTRTNKGFFMTETNLGHTREPVVNVNVFPKDIPHDLDFLFDDLNSFWMHAWDNEREDLSCLGVLKNYNGVMVGTVGGNVKIYTAHGSLLGQLLIGGDPNWGFQFRRSATDTQAIEQALDRMKVTKDGEYFTSAVDRMTDEAPQRGGGKRLEYTKGKERYMEAVAPFYMEIRKDQVDAAVPRAFFLPGKGGTNVVRETMYENSVRQEYIRRRREVMGANMDFATLPQYKEYMLARKRGGVGTLYEPAYESRAVRMSLEKQPWQITREEKLTKANVYQSADIHDRDVDRNVGGAASVPLGHYKSLTPTLKQIPRGRKLTSPTKGMRALQGDSPLLRTKSSLS